MENISPQGTNKVEASADIRRLGLNTSKGSSLKTIPTFPAAGT